MRSGQPGRFSFSRRAHLLTTRRGGGIAYGNRALSEGDAASAEALWTMPHHAVLLSLSTQLVCGKRSQNTVASPDGIPPTARTNLPLAALFAVMTIS